MKVLEMNSASLGQSAENIFVPMSEVQMAATKGGTDWPSHVPYGFEETVEDLMDDLSGLIDYLNDVLPVWGIGEGDWDDLQGDLADEGLNLPDWDQLDPFYGGDEVSW